MVNVQKECNGGRSDGFVIVDIQTGFVMADVRTFRRICNGGCSDGL